MTNANLFVHLAQKLNEAFNLLNLSMEIVATDNSSISSNSRISYDIPPKQ